MNLIFVVICALVQYTSGAGLEVLYQWKYLDWVWPNVPLTGSEYIFGNAFTQDVDVDRIGRVFVTSPRWLKGVPISLSTLSNLDGPGGPLLLPYPDWTWFVPNTCDSIISVYRVAIDECDRLWVVDSGRAESKAVCPTKILIFDLKTDQLIHKYVIPDYQTFSGKASLVTPIVEIGKSCLDAFLYIADVEQNGVEIYDLKNVRSWRLNNTRGNAFGPDPETDAMFITIAGEQFDLTDGVLGMSLSPPGFFDRRYLYFNSLASYYQKFTDVNSLKESLYREPLVFQSIQKRASQAGVQATSRRGVLFFQLVQKTAIACWNIEKPFTAENIVTIAQDEEKLQYVSGIKVVVNKYGVEELWFNTNRLQKTINKTLRPDEINFRIIRGNVDEIIQGTKCENSGLRNRAPDISSWQQI